MTGEQRLRDAMNDAGWESIVVTPRSTGGLGATGHEHDGGWNINVDAGNDGVPNRYQVTGRERDGNAVPWHPARGRVPTPEQAAGVVEEARAKVKVKAKAP